MSKWWVLLVAALMCVPLALAGADGSAAADGDVSIEGYVNTQSASANIGMAGVSVVIYAEDSDNVVTTCRGTTGASGLFKIALGSGITGSLGWQLSYSFYIDLGLEGYDVRSLPDTASEPAVDINGKTSNGNSFTAKDVWKLDLTKATAKDGVYMLTSDSAAGTKCFTMASTTGSATVQVLYEEVGLQDAKVTLRPVSATNVRVHSESTDVNGLAHFSDLTIGSYYVDVSCGGFRDSERSVMEVDNESSTTDVNAQIVMTELKHTSYFGMELDHFLLCIGVILALAMAVISVAVYRNLGRVKVDSSDMDDAYEPPLKPGSGSS